MAQNGAVILLAVLGSRGRQSWLRHDAPAHQMAEDPQPQKSEAFFASPVGCSDSFTLDLHSTR
jgi:hypothetical protein